VQLFGVGAAEAALVLVIALIVVGPQRFPEIARSGGRWYRIARRFTAEVTRDLRVAVDEIDAEIQSEAGELRSIRDISTDIERDLKATEQEIDAADADANARVTSDDAEARRPTPLTGSVTPKPATPAPDPSSQDPFVALEAKRAAEPAAADEDASPSDARDSAGGGA
jgi:sec-independent protein translocase protein TatB